MGALDSLQISDCFLSYYNECNCWGGGLIGRPPHANSAFAHDSALRLTAGQKLLLSDFPTRMILVGFMLSFGHFLKSYLCVYWLSAFLFWFSLCDFLPRQSSKGWTSSPRVPGWLTALRRDITQLGVFVGGPRRRRKPLKENVHKRSLRVRHLGKYFADVCVFDPTAAQGETGHCLLNAGNTQNGTPEK